MKSILIIIFFAQLTVFAQPTARVETFANIAGQPFFPRTYTDVNGTPYLFEDWTPATIELHNGGVIKNVKTNFNLVTDELLYLDEKGAMMAANANTVESIRTGTRTFVTTTAKSSYFEIVSTQGKATLLLHHKKVIIESKLFNSATVQKDFRIRETYMLAVGPTITEVKSVNDIYDALTPADALKDFAKKEKLRPKSEGSWIKIVNHYNSF
jgi:hypothetical protein